MAKTKPKKIDDDELETPLDLTRNDSESHDPLDGVTSGASTLTVACKLPHGMLMQLHTMVPHQEQVFGGGVKETSRAESVGEPIKLNGTAAHHGQDSPHDIRSGYALTYGVPRDFFQQWLKEQKESTFIKEGLIFACSSKSSTESKAREMKGLKTGLERLDPNNLPRISRRHRIETAKLTESAEA